MGNVTETASSVKTEYYSHWCRHCRVYVGSAETHQSQKCSFCHKSYCEARSGDHSTCFYFLKQIQDERDRKNRGPIPVEEPIRLFPCNFCRGNIESNLMKHHLFLILCDVCKMEHPRCINDPESGTCRNERTIHNIMQSNMDMTYDIARILKNRIPDRSYTTIDGKIKRCPDNICPVPPPPPPLTRTQRKDLERREAEECWQFSLIVFCVISLILCIIADVYWAYITKYAHFSIVLWVLNGLLHIFLFCVRIGFICVCAVFWFFCCLFMEFCMFVTCSLAHIINLSCEYEHDWWSNLWDGVVFVWNFPPPSQ